VQLQKLTKCDFSIAQKNSKGKKCFSFAKIMAEFALSRVIADYVANQHCPVHKNFSTLRRIAAESFV
jgi:hypothetical protein